MKRRRASGLTAHPAERHEVDWGKEAHRRLLMRNTLGEPARPAAERHFVGAFHDR